MINIAICDDERAEITYLTALVLKWEASRNTSVRLSDYESAESFLFAREENQSIDVLILDIQKGKIDGIELARQIRRDNEIMQIVFISGYRFNEVCPTGNEDSDGAERWARDPLVAQSVRCCKSGVYQLQLEGAA